MIFHFLVQVSTWQTLNMDQEKYFRIRLKTIRPDKITNFNIYVRIGDRKLLYIKAGDTLNGEKINELHDKDSGENFFVLESDRQKYRDWIREEINSSQLTPRNKADVLRESSVSLMEDLFANPDVNKALDEAKPIINDFLDFMDAAPQSMGYLLSLSGHDFYTYNHSLDVSIYSLGLGQALNFSRSDLEELGVASLFHDIGKRHVPLEILCKKGSLTDEEWEQMKMHPQYGLIILNEHPDTSSGIKAACFEHHESWSGNGYPQEIKGHEIHPYARIVALTDTYDAMTTQRSYNSPMLPKDALTMMKEKLAGRYDPEMLKAMYSVLFKMKIS